MALSHARELNGSAKSIDPFQPVQSAQDDVHRSTRSKFSIICILTLFQTSPGFHVKAFENNTGKGKFAGNQEAMVKKPFKTV